MESTPLSVEQSELLALGQALERTGYAFTTVTPETHRRVLERAARRGETDARSLRDVFGWNKPFDRSTLPPELFSHLACAQALEPAGERFRSRVRFSTLGDALLVHSAFPTDAEDSVFFGPDTYRFATLLHRWAPSARRVVDIGTGTGAGGIVLAGRTAERLVLTDVNPLALAYARINLTLAGASAELMHSDVLQNCEGRFDLIVANPPYMRDPASRSYRHGGGDFGEALSVRIVREALPRLASDGVLILYTGSAIVQGVDTFRSAVQPLLAGFDRAKSVVYEELDPDVFGDELESAEYATVDRIAAVGLRVRVN